MINLEDATSLAERLQKRLCRYSGSKCDCKSLDSPGNGEKTGCFEARQLIKFLKEQKPSGGRYLKCLRAELGQTLRDVESQTGISNSYLSQLESGRIGDPSFTTMMRLANHYGVELNNFTNGYLGIES